MVLKSRGPIAVVQGWDFFIKKRGRYKWIRVQLLNILNSGGEMNMPLSAKKTASFQGLFVLFLLGAEDPPAKKKEERNDEGLGWTHQHSQSIPFCSSLYSPPQWAINIKETITNILGENPEQDRGEGL